MIANPIRLLLADDEPIALRGLDRLIQGESGVEIVARCAHGEEALAEIRARRPDVALLDIAMPGLSGVDIVRALPPADRPFIVFLTAFDRYAIDAFDVNAVDYLLKPFDEDRFRVAFQRIRERVLAGRGTARIAVKDGDRVVLIALADIAWCEAEDNYVRIHASTGRHLVRMTMRDLMNRLDARRFARIHRSYVVNIARVRELRPADRSDYQVLLHDGTRLPMTRSYRDAVLGLLNPE